MDNTDISISDVPHGHQTTDIAITDTLQRAIDGFEEVVDALERQRQAAANLHIPLKIRSKIVGIHFCFIPAGTFIMGSPENEEGRSRDEVQHRVTITKPFYMGKFQVTNAQWQIVTGKYPTKLHETGENAPVESVSWNDCQGFLRKLAELEGLTDNSFRLPTEAEWEYACRAGTEARFYTGDSEDDLASARWFGKNSIRAHPVGHKTPNTWGLYDMHGNVWEWCQDWYDAYPNSDLTDPLGPTTGRCRVLRGGSYGFFDNNATKCRAANRSSDSPDDTYGTFGFRCVRGL